MVYLRTRSGAGRSKGAEILGGGGGLTFLTGAERRAGSLAFMRPTGWTGRPEDDRAEVTGAAPHAAGTGTFPEVAWARVFGMMQPRKHKGKVN